MSTTSSDVRLREYYGPDTSSGRDELSFMAIGTILVRRRRQILYFVLFGGVVGVTSALVRHRTYVATASFVSASSGDASRSTLAGLAGQFGVPLPSTGQPSPEFYAGLCVSRTLLLPILHDTVTDPDLDGGRVTLLNLLKVGGTDVARREDEGIKALRRMIGTSVAKTTGIVTVGVTTRWRSVSYAIANALVVGVNDFNQTTRRSQAGAERRFIETRLAVATAELRADEEAMQRFLEANRVSSAPELIMQRDRLQRNVTLRQSIVTSLNQSYEDARAREVRDTPIINLVEAPYAPVQPEGRGVLIRGVLGVFLGALVGATLSLFGAIAKRRREAGDAEALEFVSAIQEMKGHPLGSRRRSASEAQQ